MSFLSRWLFALGLLTATYNPTQFNYIRWVSSYGDQNLSIAVLFGLLLIIGYIIYVRATLRSIGGVGMALILAIVGAALWVLYDVGLLTLSNTSVNIWLGLLALSLVLGVGLSWSHVRRRLSGQADMDDVDD